MNATRRIRSRFFLLWVTAAFAALAFFLHQFARATFRPSDFVSGLVLYALILMLGMLNTRKKIPFVPLLKVSTWLQVHIYAGLLCVWIFLLHIEFRLPQGWLEIFLTALFGIVVFSGVGGLLLSRWLPPRMTESGESLFWEDIDGYQTRIEDEVRDLVLAAERKTQSNSISEFYFSTMEPYLSSRPHWFTLPRANPAGYYDILAKIRSLKLYLNDEELEYATELEEWADTKRNLDFQFTSQRLLKYWLFIHIPFTAALIIIGTLHGVLALFHAARF